MALFLRRTSTAIIQQNVPFTCGWHYTLLTPWSWHNHRLGAVLIRPRRSECRMTHAVEGLWAFISFLTTSQFTEGHVCSCYTYSIFLLQMLAFAMVTFPRLTTYWQAPVTWYPGQNQDQAWRRQPGKCNICKFLPNNVVKTCHPVMH